MACDIRINITELHHLQLSASESACLLSASSGFYPYRRLFYFDCDMHNYSLNFFYFSFFGRRLQWLELLLISISCNTPISFSWKTFVMSLPFLVDFCWFRRKLWTQNLLFHRIEETNLSFDWYDFRFVAWPCGKKLMCLDYAEVDWSKSVQLATSWKSLFMMTVWLTGIKCATALQCDLWIVTVVVIACSAWIIDLLRH